MIDRTGILQWLENWDFVEKKNHIIDNVIDVTMSCIENKNLNGFNNSNNRLADVFDLVYAYVKIEVAPDENSTDEDVADYGSLMDDSADLPLIVYRIVKKHFNFVTCSPEDVKYCEYVINKGRNVWHFQRNTVSL